VPAALARLSESPAGRRWSGAALLAMVTLLALGLRLRGLWDAELDIDEGATWYFAGLTLADQWGEIGAQETNPPLFYTLAHLVRALGATAEQERLLSVLAGTACVPLGYLLARRMAGRFAGFAAALLIALSAVQIETSQYARTYAALAVAALAALLAVQRLLAGGGMPARAGFVAAALAALYLHNTAVLLVTACNLLVFLAWLADPARARGFLLRWIGINAAVLVGYAPWIAVVTDQSLHTLAHFWLAPPTLAAFRYEVMNTFALRYLSWGEPYADWFFLVLLAAGIAGAWRTRFAPALAVAVLAGVPLASFAISQWRPIMNGKTLLWLMPVGLVCVGAGCASLGRLRWPALALAAGLEAAAVAHAPEPFRVDWPALAARIAAQQRDGAALVVGPEIVAFMLDHYGLHHGLPAGAVPTFTWGRHAAWFPQAAAPELPPERARAVLGGFAHVWVVTNGALGHDPAALRAQLDCAFTVGEQAPPGGHLAVLRLDRRPAPACDQGGL